MVRTFAMRSDSSPLTILNAGTLHRKSQQDCLLATFDDSVARFFDVSAGRVVEADTQPIPRRGSPDMSGQSGRSE